MMFDAAYADKLLVLEIEKASFVAQQIHDEKDRMHHHRRRRRHPIFLFQRNPQVPCVHLLRHTNPMSAIDLEEDIPLMTHILISRQDFPKITT